VSIEPGRAVGGYEIERLIGEGGMGSVYRAYQRTLGRYVAIKIIAARSADEPGFQERFATEGQAIARLRHPNIVTAFDFARDGGVVYLVSEFIDGGTLADQIGRPLPIDYVIRMLGPLASALDYAHARGVLHRDVKPSNVLIQRDGTPVLTDFGLARIIGPSAGVTLTNAPLGTLEYMSPEAASGKEIGPAADQYGLAVIAYEMLSGKTPFKADTPIAVLLAQISKPPPSLSERGVRLAPGIEEALLVALRKEPEDRYPSVSEFMRALQAPPPPVAAVPAPVPSQTALAPVPIPAVTPPRRRRWPLAALALLAITAVVLMLGPQEAPTAPAGELATLTSVSPPLALDRGAQGECLAAYYNGGANAWVKGTSSEVKLVLDTDAVPAELQTWATDLGEGAVAEQRQDSIAPGQTGVFAVAVVVPAESTERQAELVVYPVQATARIGQNASCLVSVR
jgi:serine/threonine-protein kinase